MADDLHLFALCIVYDSERWTASEWEWSSVINAITVESDWRNRGESRRNAGILMSSILRIKTRIGRGTGCGNRRCHFAMPSETPIEAEWNSPDMCWKQCGSLTGVGNISGFSDLWFINLTKRWTVIISFSGNTPVCTSVLYAHTHDINHSSRSHTGLLIQNKWRNVLLNAWN